MNINKNNLEPVKTQGKYVYYGKWTDDNLNTLHELIDEVGWFLPRWVQYVNLNYEATDVGDAFASCSINYGYRTANLIFYPIFFIQSELDRKDIMLHELSHVFGKVISDYARVTMKRIVPNDAVLLEVVVEEMNERNEAFAQDISCCILEKFYTKGK